MKTETIIVRKGELLGPIDWNYDFKKHYKDIYPASCNGEETHERMFQQAMTILHMLEAEPEKYEATVYGGWPRCGWGKILHVGMYDGWPYWRPIPSIMLSSALGGGEWHAFHNITDIRLKGEEWPLKIDPQREAIVKGIFDINTSIRKAVERTKHPELVTRSIEDE